MRNRMFVYAGVVSALAILSCGRAHGQWLAEEKQAEIKSLWPAGVEFPPTLKFYKRQLAQQRIKILNNQPYWAFHPLSGLDPQFDRSDASANQVRTTVPELEIWQGSGGMHHSPKDEWKNFTGLALPPDSKILVWMGKKAIPTSGQQLDAMFWQFPPGTKAFDVLTATRPEGAHIFEIRVRTRGAKDWDEGVTFRPYDEAPASASLTTWNVDFPEKTRSAIKLPSARVTYPVYTVKEVDRTRPFRPSTILVADESGFLPSKYLGTGSVSCNRCHLRAGEAREYAGGCVSGNDSVLSFNPVTEDSINREYFGKNPTLDFAWPLEVYKAKR